MAADLPKDQNHAFRIGMVWGAFMRAEIPALPLVTDEGDYTDTLIVNLSEIVGEPLEVHLKVESGL